MRNYDIEFDRQNNELHYTRSNCSKDFDPNLSPRHKNNILQEVPWPRVLPDITNGQNFSNDTNVVDTSHNVSETGNSTNLTKTQAEEIHEQADSKYFYFISGWLTLFS